jgi:pyruvate kinase
MKKTKIVCTIGPACEKIEVLEKMPKHGMNIARLNFSHANHEYHLSTIKKIEEINSKLEVPISILLDTQGPAIRLGTFAEKANLIEGEEVTITTKDVPCTKDLISVTYKKLPESVTKGSLIYIADGTIELKVKDVEGTEVKCEIIIGGEVNTRKNVNIPGVKVDLPALSEKDKDDIKFGAKHKVDFIAQSFIKSAQDVIATKKLLKELDSDAHLIAKIECMQAVEDIDNIIAAADGIMIARGDLGVQIPIEKVPGTQKMIIKKCNAAGKPVIVATQMLESMTYNSRPTRAEVTDVANAILDGADAIMLSGETARGKYPIRSVEMMGKIVAQTESRMLIFKLPKHAINLKVEDAISRSVCLTAHDVSAKAIVTCTFSGHTAKLISKYRPKLPVIAVTPHERDVKKLNIFWGIHPIQIPKVTNTDELIKEATKAVLKQNLLIKGDLVVITAGIPFNVPGNTNLMKVHTIE